MTDRDPRELVALAANYSREWWDGEDNFGAGMDNGVGLFCGSWPYGRRATKADLLPLLNLTGDLAHALSDALDRAERAEEHLTTAVSFFENYGQHHGWCDTRKDSSACNCGHDDALAAMRQASRLKTLPESPEAFLTDEDRRGLRTQLDSIARRRQRAEADWQNIPLAAYDEHSGEASRGFRKNAKAPGRTSGQPAERCTCSCRLRLVMRTLLPNGTRKTSPPTTSTAGRTGDA